ncbi:MAG: sodium:solute symporter, partial [Phaeodactylibacter sp.]|nr:sodium:solute symporter [Phaeodactylibacter sp.]
GGVFLFLSYFGTDQSQVQRYLSGKSLTESRLGLLFNGIIKVPMQFLVLFTGILVFIFFQFQKPPVHFNEANMQVVEASVYADSLRLLDEAHSSIFEEKKTAIFDLMAAIDAGDEALVASRESYIEELIDQDNAVREEVKSLITKTSDQLETEDKDYIFINFIMNYMPIGIIGLLLAVIFSAAMSSTASELNALATTTVIDLYKRSFVPDASDSHYLNASKLFTVLWGCLALSFAMMANLFDNLIEAVNIVGSIFYGTILGIFVVAFFLKQVRGKAVFIAALIAEAIVIAIYILDSYEHIHIAYLWLNLIGCMLVLIISLAIQKVLPKKKNEPA